LTVTQVAPDCRVVGTMRVRGHRGVNRIRFRGRVHGRALQPGTYVLRARTAKAKVVIFDRQPSRAELAAARASNTCGGAQSHSGLAGGAVAPGIAHDGSNTAARPGTMRPLAKAERQQRRSASGVLGVRFDRAGEAVKNVPAALYLLLGIAIALLLLAAVPLRWVPSGRLASTLAYRGRSLTVAGAIALAVVAVTYVVI
jgi:hypothetical protein